MTDFNQRIDKLRELDKARTQGEWEIDKTCPHGVSIYGKYGSIAKMWNREYNRPDKNTDAAFIAAAPEMMQVIEELDDKAEGLKTDLNELIRVCMTKDLNSIKDFVKMNYPKQLAEIEGV